MIGEPQGGGEEKEGSCTRDTIVNSDFLYDIVEYVIDNVTIAEAVGLANPLIITDLDTTGVVAGFGITITNLYSTGDPVRGDPEAAD